MKKICILSPQLQCPLAKLLLPPSRLTKIRGFRNAGARRDLAGKVGLIERKQRADFYGHLGRDRCAGRRNQAVCSATICDLHALG